MERIKLCRTKKRGTEDGDLEKKQQQNEKRKREKMNQRKETQSGGHEKNGKLNLNVENHEKGKLM